VKRIAVLPTLLTLGNGMCGFAAIAYASKITLDGSLTTSEVNYYFVLSAGLILAAMVFDALDGAAARLSRSSSEFGGQLDSLCDVISFGAAPAFLLLRLGQEWNDRPLVGKAVAVVAALYLACTVLRLARFNMENSPEPVPVPRVGGVPPVPGVPAPAPKKFKGLPSPAAGGALASLAVLRSDLTAHGSWTGTGINEQMLRDFVSVWAPIGAFVLALLMVSQLPYPHFTRQLLRGRRNFRFVVQVVLIASVVALAPEVAFFLLFWVYALSAPIRYLILQTRRPSVAEPHLSE